MKKLLILLLLCCGTAFADGPIFQHKETFDQQEFENVYQNLRQITLFTSSGTKRCIDIPTFCVDTVGHQVSILALSTTTLAANLRAGGFKITGLAAGTANGDSVRFEQLSQGKILQTVIVSTADAQKTSTSGAYATTGLSGSITLLSSTSRVRVTVMQSYGASGTAGTICTVRIRRDATSVSTPGDFHVTINNSATEFDTAAGLLASDLPGGVGPFVYGTFFARSSGAGTCIVNTQTGAVGGNGGYMLLEEIGQ